MKLRFRDKAICILLLCSIVTYLVFSNIVIPANKKVEKLKEKREKVAALMTDIKPLLEEKAEKEKKRDNAEKKYNEIKNNAAYKTATSEEFLVYLGRSAEANGVKVTGFSDLGSKNENGIYRSFYDMELSGSAFAVGRVVRDFDLMGITYSVGSISMRQDKEYDYLKRFFDTMSNLKWYNEPEENAKKEDEKTESDASSADKPTTALPPAPQQKSDNPSPKTEENKQTEKNENVESKPDAADNPDDIEGFVLPETGSIEERLNELLKINSFASYRPVPIAGIASVSNDTSSEEIRLSLTICLIMFNEPSPETSFLAEQESEENNEVL